MGNNFSRIGMIKVVLPPLEEVANTPIGPEASDELDKREFIPLYGLFQTFYNMCRGKCTVAEGGFGGRYTLPTAAIHAAGSLAIIFSLDYLT